MRLSTFTFAAMLPAAMVLTAMHEADAQRVRAGGGAGGGAAASRSTTATRRTASANRSTASVNRGNYNGTARASRTTVNRNAQVNQNVNVNRNVNVDVDNGCCGNGEVLAVAGAVAVTAAVVGSVTPSIPPSCTPVMSGGVTYQQCGSTWYQPQYAGTSVSYVVTNPPQ
jgi:hypothetical protein